MFALEGGKRKKTTSKENYAKYVVHVNKSEIFISSKHTSDGSKREKFMHDKLRKKEMKKYILGILNTENITSRKGKK